MNVGEKLALMAKEQPRKVVLVDGDIRLDFAELNRIANAVAKGLAQEGVRPGDVVALMLGNRAEFAYLYYGAMKLGAIVAPIDPRMAAPEIEKLLMLTETKKTFVDRKERLAELPHAVLVTGAEFHGRYLASGPREELSCPLDEDDVALYLHTSGTTGIPKVVELCYRHLDWFPQVMAEVWGTNETSILGMTLPMSHISGPIALNALVTHGSRLVIIRDVSPSSIFSAISKEKITVTWAVPPIFSAMARFARGSEDLSSLRFVAMMGTGVPLATMELFKKTFPGVPVLQGYGLTETSPFLTGLPVEFWQSKMGSIGRAVPRAEIVVMGEDGEILPPGQPGEIAARGPMVMKGYLKNPEATRARFRDGWFLTGDAGKMDEEGFFYHLGRNDDLIVTEKGLKLYPGEVENTLLSHPAVADAAVAMREEMPGGGKVLKAFVVLASNQEASEADLRVFCQKFLAPFKVPRVFAFRDALPKSPTHKTVRAALA